MLGLQCVVLYHVFVNVCRLLLDTNSGSVSELAVSVMNLLMVLCSSEPVQMIGISSRHVISVSVLIEL